MLHDLVAYDAPVIVPDDHDGADVEHRARDGTSGVGADQVALDDPIEVDGQLAHDRTPAPSAHTPSRCDRRMAST